MAIAARHQSFVHAMVNGLGKLWLNLEVATVTQHGLRHHQQSAFHFRMMSRMAINASDVILQVLGAQKVCMLLSELVAAQAPLARLLAREFFKADDLCNIASGFRMRLARSVAGLASLILHATVIEQRLPVRSVIVSLRNVVMTRLACVRTRIQRWIGRIVDEMFALFGISILLRRRCCLLI